MRSSITLSRSLGAALALAATITGGVVSPTGRLPDAGTYASPASQKQSPATPGTPQDQQERRRRFVSASNPSRQARALRKSTGSHKQNRRRSLATR